MKNKETELTHQQIDFCYKYVANKYKPAAAAIAVGYSQRSAAQISSRLLKKDNIQKKIEEIKKSALRNIQIESERVLEEIAKNAFSDIKDYINIESGVVSLKDFSELGEKTSCIKRIKTRITKDGDTEIDFYLHDKDKSLELLGKHLQIFKEKESPGFNININADDMKEKTADEVVQMYRQLLKSTKSVS